MSDFRFSIDEIWFRERPVKFRMPFRFGIITLEQAPEAYVFARITTSDGASHVGVAADLMAPKWFDKNTDLSNEDNIDQLRASIDLASACYLSDNVSRTAFDFYAGHSSDHLKASVENGMNGLVSGFGRALVDRALLDAMCRAANLSIFDAIKTNLPGITAALTPDLSGFDLTRFLTTLSPARTIQVRHTIGMTDAISEAENDAKGIDNLPRSLEANCAAYGLKAFKIKLSGHATNDLKRLRAIAGVLDELPTSYFTTLDANEQFSDPTSFTAFWDEVKTDNQLARLRSSVRILEQPINRQATFDHALGALGEELPVEIDEADGSLDAFVVAKTLGYRGVSSKSCKGFYKSLINRARVEMWNDEVGENKFFMSAEDLSTQAGTALQQDLCLVTLIGCTHVERNGHQYGDGLSGAQADWRKQIARDHDDLYEMVGERVNLKITDGVLSLKSLAGLGFGTRILPPNTIGSF